MRANRSTRPCVFLQAELVSPRDTVGLHGRSVGYRGRGGTGSPHLAALREVMTPDEIERAKGAIKTELLRREPTPPRPN